MVRPIYGCFSHAIKESYACQHFQINLQFLNSSSDNFIKLARGSLNNIFLNCLNKSLNEMKTHVRSIILIIKFYSRSIEMVKNNAVATFFISFSLTIWILAKLILFFNLITKLCSVLKFSTWKHDFKAACSQLNCISFSSIPHYCWSSICFLTKTLLKVAFNHIQFILFIIYSMWHGCIFLVFNLV